MTIACIAWGSLVWAPRQLACRGTWNNDGPLLPVEFCRQSEDGRLTLVIVPGKPEVRSLWTLMSSASIEEARSNLAEREGITKDIEKKIAVWRADGSTDESNRTVAQWARQHELSAALWTALPAKFNKVERCPSEVEAVDYLRNLPYERRRIAEEYVRRTPKQVDTDFRRIFEREFGWTPIR